jgi:hypothetical protein
VTAFLYFVSDVMLACVFEPVMLLVLALGKRSVRFGRFIAAFKEASRKTAYPIGAHTGPFKLVMIAFGVDPMTGRAAAVAAGHGFVAGWAFAIAGDMIYFAVLMVSTLWLNGILGDGTWTTIIILALMFGIPAIAKRVRERREATSSSSR